MCTRALKGSTISWWGKRRWQIEGWFKTAKHRFGLHRGAQSTKLGLYRWLILAMVSFVLAHWAYLLGESQGLPEWQPAAQRALELFLNDVALALFLIDLEQLHTKARKHGLELDISWCKI